MVLHEILSFKKLVSYGKVVRFPHFETIFKVVFLIIITATLINFNSILNFRAYAKQENITVIAWSELKIIPAIWALIYVIIVVILKLMKFLIHYFTIDYVSLNLNEKYQGQVRQMRIKKSIKWLFDTTRYSATTIFAWYYFHDTDWFPTSLGGSGQCENFYQDYPNFPTGEVHKYLGIFYILQLACHLYSMLELIILGKEIELKFWEYLLHHYVACILIFFSLTLNIVKLGAVVLVIHDLSDSLLSAGRSYSDFKTSNKTLVYVLFSAVQITWIYTRIYVFPVCILTNQLSYVSSNEQLALWTKRNFIAIPQIFQTILLIVLLFMHLYWTCFMVKVGMGIFKSGKYNNVYDNKENKLDNIQSKQKQP